MPDEITDRLETLAQKPQIVEADGVKVEQHDLKQIVEADRYLSNRNAASKPHRGLRFSKIVPPGAV